MEVMHTIIAAMLVISSIHIGTATATLANETIISGIAWGQMSLYLRNSYSVYHMEEDRLYAGNILFSDEHSIRTTDGKNTTVLAGKPGTKGYLEGVGTVARMNVVTGFYQINDTHVLFTDQANHCLRLLDRTTGKTESFAGKCSSSGFQDGIDSRFYYPWSVILDETSPNKFIVADSSNHAMRRVDLHTRRVTTFFKMASTTPRGVTINRLDHLLITQSFMISELRLADKHNTRLVGSTTSGFRNGAFETAQFGYIYEIINFGDEIYLVVGSDDVIRIVDRGNSWVRSICSGTKGHTNGNLISCELYNPRSLLFVNNTLYIGDQYGIRMMSVRKFNPYAKCPPAQMAAQVAVGAEEAAVEVVPGVVAHLSPGYHKFNLPGTSCTTYVSVSGPGISDPHDTCPKEVIVVAEPGSKIGYYSYRSAGVTHRIALPLGTHSYDYGSEGRNCSVQIRIVGDNLKRRLDFTAKYSVSCQVMQSADAGRLLRALAVSRYSQIKEICLQKCKEAPGVASSLVEMSCESSVLTIRWPTNVMFDGGVTSIPTDLLTDLRAELKRRSKILDLVIYSQIPPVVFPILDDYGLPATPILTSVCYGNQKYNSHTDSCVD